MRFRDRSLKNWLGFFRYIANGVRLRPKQTFHYIWNYNPFAPATWLIFSVNVHGESFLRDFAEACGEARMDPFLMWGTLLGCVREGGFLKHDTDIDVGILAPDWPKRRSLIEAMRRRGHGLVFSRNYKMRFLGRDLLAHLDVDVFFPWEGKMICFDIQESNKLVGAWFPLDAFDNFRSLTFSGIRVSIPDPPERVLETVYGDWRTPVKEYDWSRIPNWLHIADGATWPKLTDDYA